MDSHAMKHRQSEQAQADEHRKMGSYGRFAAMIAVSTALGYAVMYMNTYELDHVYWSWTRFFMSMIMASVMIPTMLFFMKSMYTSKRANAVVLGIAAALFVGGVSLVRSQATVGDVAYMRAMIPHHSIAILTSERANITDPRVRKLADEIIEAQKREIGEMKEYIADLDH